MVCVMSLAGAAIRGEWNTLRSPRQGRTKKARIYRQTGDPDQAKTLAIWHRSGPKSDTTYLLNEIKDFHALNNGTPT